MEICELKVLISRPEILLASESVVYSIIFSIYEMPDLWDWTFCCGGYDFAKPGKGTVSSFLVCIKPTKKRKADRTSRVSIKQQLESWKAQGNGIPDKLTIPTALDRNHFESELLA